MVTVLNRERGKLELDFGEVMYVAAVFSAWWSGIMKHRYLVLLTTLDINNSGEKNTPSTLESSFTILALSRVDCSRYVHMKGL